MTFARRSLHTLCLGLLLAAVSPRPCAAQAAPQPATAQPTTAQPAAQAYTLPPDKLAKAIALNRIRNIMDIVYSLWGLGVLWLLLSTRTAARLAAWAERRSRRPRLQGLLFFAVLIAILTVANLPPEAFSHAVSLSYGISVQGWASWLGDQGKSLGLAVVFIAPLLLLFNSIVRAAPRRYWLWCWLVSLPLIVLITFAEPLAEPLFYEFEPLTKNHPALVDELEKVAARTGTNIPPDRMFLMKASAKSNGLNAYVSGIGATKRIVVWDTTAGRIPDDEVMFVFGHESGHYVLNHIPKILTGYAIALFFVFWACAGFAGWLARRFGARWGLSGEPGAKAPLSTRAGFVVLIFAVSAAAFVLEPADNTFSRFFEHEADVYGQEAIHGLVPNPQKTAAAGFQALGEAWLEDPDPSPFIEFWEYSHPSVKNRANFAANYDPWANGGHGQFFDK
jgi:Zn-dependent protease with chaperone function